MTCRVSSGFSGTCSIPWNLKQHSGFQRHHTGILSYLLCSFRVILCAALAAACSGSVCGQSLVGPDPGLPSAPEPQSTTPPDNQKTGMVSGTVIDPNGSVVQGATVTLSRNGHPYAVLQSGSNGQFNFPGLPTGSFTVTVTGANMGTGRSPDITLAAGEVSYLKPIVLPVSGGTTSVVVTANQDELAEEEVHIAESQRVLGIVPNFYTSFNWNAPPMNGREKFQLAWRSFFDPVTPFEAGAIAGGEQIVGAYPGFGSGATGFGKRYGAAVANTFISRMLNDAVFPAILRQDPRYFYKGTGTTRSRAVYAMEQAVMTRGNNGRQQVAYSHFLAYFATGGISNLYYPDANRGAALVFENGLIEIAGDAAANLLREFVLPRFTNREPRHSSKVP